MPRTRNVSRSQWDAANAMNENNAKGTGHDSEKENASRAPRARTRTAGRAVLGAVPTTANTRATGSKSKGKGKGDPPPKRSVTKVEKLPFEDITSQFLPAPESQNRGHAQPGGFGEPETNVFSPVPGPSTAFAWDVSNDVRLAQSVRQYPAFPSSLPPSSPPPASSNPADCQPQLPTLSRSPSPFHGISRRLFPDVDSEAPAYNPWDEFDHQPGVVGESDAASEVTPRNSDPFGFFALERRLKVEREEDQDEVEAGGLLLKDDPSSPSNFKLTFPGLETVDEAPEVSNEGSPNLPPTPPTPHKKRVLHQTASPSGDLEDDRRIFNPSSCSCPSSPSPSKPRISSSKRKQAEVAFDALHDEVDDGSPLKRKRMNSTKQRIPRVETEDEPQPLRRSRRGKSAPVADEENADAEAGPSRRSRPRKGTKQPKRTSASKKERTAKAKKATISPGEDSDVEEKREQERQERIAYFRKLEDYEFETENVYVI